MPPHIKAFIEGFHGPLSEQEFNSTKFAYRVLFLAKSASNKNQADTIVEFVRPDDSLSREVNRYVITKETEPKKYLPKNVVETMKIEGYTRFKIHHHTEYWKELDAKNPQKGFGILVEKTWYWYEKWMEEVRKHCKQNEEKFK